MRQLVMIGGDMRCHYLAAYLKEQGVYVTTYKVPDCENEYSSWPMLSEAFRNDSTVEERVLLLPVLLNMLPDNGNAYLRLSLQTVSNYILLIDFLTSVIYYRSYSFRLLNYYSLIRRNSCLCSLLHFPS